jgi:dTDP-4-amino-4,6-dideoxygalactose transaminase
VDETMIRCLVPDLPEARALLPWLERIDANRWYTNSGPLVREFERLLLGFISSAGPASCVGVSSGMAALELGLRALGIGPGHRVLLPALTFPATALAVVRCGAEPVLGEVCPRRWAMTAAIAHGVMERERIDLVMPVATFGVPLPHDEWDELGARTGVPVLADAAAALGAQAIGNRVHWAFSLHATKPMGIGEGGLFVSPDAEVTERVRRLANFGFGHRVIEIDGGTNAKLSEYAAAVGLAQLSRWPQLTRRRREVLDDYRRALAALPDVQLQAGLDVPPATLCLQLPVDAAAVAAGLADDAIETRRWYLPPLHRHPAFRHLRTAGADGEILTTTQALADRLLGLPFHTRLSTEDVRRVVNSLAGQIGKQRAVAPGPLGDAG